MMTLYPTTIGIILRNYTFLKDTSVLREIPRILFEYRKFHLIFQNLSVEYTPSYGMCYTKLYITFKFVRIHSKMCPYKKDGHYKLQKEHSGINFHPIQNCSA